MKELDHEERITGRFVMYQLSEWRGAVRIAAKSIGNQMRNVFAGKRRKNDLLHFCAGVLHGVKPAPQRMSSIDLVVPIGADQHQVLQIGPGQQVLNQIERGRVEPLEIVEEQRQWMIGACENTYESSEHDLEAVLRLLRGKLRNGRLFSYDQLQFGDEVDDEPSIWAQRLMKGLTPARQLGVVLAQKRSHKTLESLHQRRIGNVALVLVELA